MGKKKIGFKKPKHGIDDLVNAASSDEDGLEDHLESLLDDEIDKYNAATENSLLSKSSKAKSRKRQYDDSEDEEQEIYGLSDGEDKDEDDDEMDDDSDEEDDDNDEDILGKEDEDSGVPDSRAWGKKSRAYFNTDYVDQDFGGFEGSDAEMAEQEETEAKEIQKRLAAEIDEGDFTEFLPVQSEKGKKSGASVKSKEILKIDLDSLSASEKLKLVQRECPEVIHMLDELKEKLKIAKELKKTIEKNTDEEMKTLYQTKFHIILNYCINISYFLHLRATKPSNCKGHPVIKRILQFRRLFDEINQFKPKPVVKSAKSSKPPKSKRPRKQFPISNKADEEEVGFGDQLKKKAKAVDTQEVEEEDLNSGELEKRGITYEMAKNKGLVPVRKKEQRNPRVKHRVKYQKAKVRRKGQVRNPRTEIKRYDGESFGIKSHVTKSIKIK